MAGTIISNPNVKVVTLESSCSRPKKKGHKGKRFHEVNEEQNSGTMDNLTDQVQSLFYHDMHFNAVNTQMYTDIDCKTRTGDVSKQTFNIDTGADGNLMPITMFTKLFPKISLNTLEKIVESGVNLYAYNNTPIRQFGVCSVRLSF